MRVLVVDDEPEVCNFFRYLLEWQRYEVTVATSGEEAKAHAGERRFDVALVDLKLPDVDGLAVLRHIKNVQPECEVIIMTGYSTIRSAVEAIKLGAYDYLQKPFEDIEELAALIARAGQAAQQGDATWPPVEEELGFVIGHNPAMQRLITMAHKVAPKEITVLIEGETGTGKEVLARFIHHLSPRAQGPFIAVNCGGFTESLLESELFGHEKGSFTGATATRRGVFELAHQGTLFLDEVGAAGPSIQVQLLRVLESGEFYRVGGERPIKTDVRIMAATNVNLAEEVKAGRFREDLYYRLDVAHFHVPPLRERREDIPLFLDFFLHRQATNMGLAEVPRFHPQVVNKLKAYAWPGNIRELANVVAHAVAMSDGTTVIEERHLPPKLLGALGEEAAAPPGARAGQADGEVLPGLLEHWASEIVTHCQAALGREEGRLSLPRLLAQLREMEAGVIRQVILAALKESMGNYQVAADRLETTPRVMRYLLREKGKKRTKAAPK